MFLFHRNKKPEARKLEEKVGMLPEMGIAAKPRRGGSRREKSAVSVQVEKVRNGAIPARPACFD